MNRFMIISAFGLLCSACASGGDAPSERVPEASIGAAGLGTQTLSPGECGLFLWTAGEPRTFVFFSKAGTDKALADIGGETVRMSRVSVDGDIFGQFMTEMRYASEDRTESLVVLIEPGDEIEQGQRTGTARITHTNADGWDTIVPAAGVRACQTE